MRATEPFRAVERFIFAAEDARRLGAIRIALFGLVAIRLATNGDYAQVAGQPSSLFDPVSLFHLLTSMPSTGLTTTAQVLGVIAAILAAGGLWPRATFPTAFALALFLNLMLNSTGKIVHNDLVVTLCLVPLLATPTAASRAWSISLPGHRSRHGAGDRDLVGVAYGWPIRTGMVIIGLATCSSACRRCGTPGSTGLRPTTSGTSSGRPVTPRRARTRWRCSSRIATGWLIFATATVVTEIGFILCLPFARLRWILVPAVVGLHVGIWLAMGLDYLPQALAVIIVFVNWVTVIEWLNRSRSRRRESATGAVAAP